MVVFAITFVEMLSQWIIEIGLPRHVFILLRFLLLVVNYKTDALNSLASYDRQRFETVFALIIHRNSVATAVGLHKTLQKSFPSSFDRQELLTTMSTCPPDSLANQRYEQRMTGYRREFADVRSMKCKLIWRNLESRHSVYPKIQICVRPFWRNGIARLR